MVTSSLEIMLIRSDELCVELSYNLAVRVGSLQKQHVGQAKVECQHLEVELKCLSHVCLFIASAF